MVILRRNEEENMLEGDFELFMETRRRIIHGDKETNMASASDIYAS